MSEDKVATVRKPRKNPATKTTLARLLQARDQVDADTVSRRQQEEKALEAFAEAEVEAQTITAEADRQVAELERQAAAVRDKAGQRMVAVDARKAAALVTLADLGRNADELAAMTGIAVKRVRAMLRQARDGEAAPAAGATRKTVANAQPGADEPAGEVPAGPAPAGTDTSTVETEARNATTSV